jgi:hypothetical protein
MVPLEAVLGTDGDDVFATAADGQRVYGLAGDDVLTGTHNATLLVG